MAKKLSLLLAAVAVVAFAVPAFAQAAPELTINGIKATKGQTLTATSTNATTQTSLGKIICDKVAVHGEVNENTGSKVHVIDDTTIQNTKGNHCLVGPNTVAVENVTLITLHTNTVGKVDFIAEFTAQIGPVHCTFHTPVGGGAGTYVATASPLVITLTNVNLLGTPAACEPGTLNGSFTVTSPNGVVVLH